MGSVGEEMLSACGGWGDVASWGRSAGVIQPQGESPVCSDLFPVFSLAKAKGTSVLENVLLMIMVKT